MVYHLCTGRYVTWSNSDMEGGWMQRVDETTRKLSAIRDGLLSLEAYIDENDSAKMAKARANRDYQPSILPVFSSRVDLANKQQISEKLYTEVCSGWRMLIDVRFKLLGFLPLASLAGSYGMFVLHSDDTPSMWILRIVISAFGA